MHIKKFYYKILVSPLHLVNMKRVFLIFAVLLATAQTKPQLPQLFSSAINTVSNFAKDALTLKFNDDRSPNGSYRYNFQTSNGITKEELGEFKNAGGGDEESLAVAGRYSYVGDDGRTYSISYRADENGFQPYGEDLVQGPKLGLSKDAVASLSNG